MKQDAWHKGYVRCLGVALAGGKLDVTEYGEPVTGNTLLVLFNADHATTVPFHLPTLGKGDRAWELAFDTFDPNDQRLETEEEGDIRPAPLLAGRLPPTHRNSRGDDLAGSHT